MVAYTKFGDNRYCCFKKDVIDFNTYVIDDRGICELTAKYKNDYRIVNIRVKRSDVDVDKDRQERDQFSFFLPDTYFDFIIENDGDMEELEEKVKKIKGKILGATFYGNISMQEMFYL